MTVWIFQACRFARALQASQADRPQDASMAWQIRMTAICENEIVTLRGDACLVRQLPKLPLMPKSSDWKVKSAPRRRGGAEKIGDRGQLERKFSRRFTDKRRAENNADQGDSYIPYAE